MISFKNNWLVQWVASGVLLGAGFVFPALWWLGIVGIALVIHLTLTTSDRKELVLGSVLAWTIKSAIALVWFWSVYPMDWMGVDSSSLQIVLIFFWWMTAALWLGAGGVAFMFGLKMLQRYTSKTILFVSIPFLWIASEMAGSLIFSIITIGVGGSITTAFSFGYVGYLLAEHNLFIQVAQIAGVYSLGITVVYISLGLFIFISQQHYKKMAYGLLAIFFLSGFIPLPVEQASNESHIVAIVDTDFGLSELRTKEARNETQQKIESAVQAALDYSPDYILLPEDSRYFNQQDNTQATAAQFSFRTKSVNVVVVDSGRADEDNKAVVQSFIYNGQEGVVDQSHKRYLVPQGEFMPSLYKAGLKLFGNDEIIDQVSKNLTFEVGSKTSQHDHVASSPGVLFCFESVSPWGVRAVLQERGSVPFIAHPVSHAWFNEPQSLWGQLDSMLRVQAIWNQQYIVSAGNFFHGYVVTPVGAIVYPETVETGEDWSLGVVTITR